MDKFTKKYLKYKTKYLNLKNQLAGSPNGKFKYSIDFPNTIEEVYKGTMFDKIEEFGSQTNPGFMSSSI